MPNLPIRNVQVGELAAAMVLAPPAVRDALALGPTEGSCRFCEAMEAGGWTYDDVDGDPNRLPWEARTLWQWHEDHLLIAARGTLDRFLPETAEPEEDEVRTIRDFLREPGSRSAKDISYAFSGAVSYYKLLIAYLLAGWRPPRVEVEMKFDDRASADLRRNQEEAYRQLALGMAYRQLFGSLGTRDE